MICKYFKKHLSFIISKMLIKIIEISSERKIYHHSGSLGMLRRRFSRIVLRIFSRTFLCIFPRIVKHLNVITDMFICTTPYSKITMCTPCEGGKGHLDVYYIRLQSSRAITKYENLCFI